MRGPSSSRVFFENPLSSNKFYLKDEELKIDISASDTTGRQVSSLWKCGAFSISFLVFKFRAQLRKTTDMFKYKQLTKQQFEMLADSASAYSNDIKPQKAEYVLLLKTLDNVQILVDFMAVILLPVYLGNNRFFEQLFFGILVFEYFLTMFRSKSKFQLISTFTIILCVILSILQHKIFIFMVLLPIFHNFCKLYRENNKIFGGSNIFVYSSVLVSTIIVNHVEACLWICLFNKRDSDDRVNYIEILHEVINQFFTISKIEAQDSYQKIFAILLVLINLVIWTLMLRMLVCFILQDKRKIKMQIHKRQVLDYLSKRTSTLTGQQQKAIGDFIQRSTEQKIDRQCSQQLISYSEKTDGQLQKELFQQSLLKFRIMNKYINTRMCEKLMRNFKEEFYLPKQIINSSRSLRVNIIQAGKAIKYFKNRRNKFQEFKEGDQFGEEEIISNQIDGCTTESNDFTTISYVSWEHLQDCLKTDRKKFEKFCMMKDIQLRQLWQLPIRETLLEKQTRHLENQRQQFHRISKIKFKNKDIHDAAIAYMMTLGIKKPIKSPYMDQIGIILRKDHRKHFSSKISGERYDKNPSQMESWTDRPGYANIENYSHLSAIGNQFSVKILDDESIQFDLPQQITVVDYQERTINTNSNENYLKHADSYSPSNRPREISEVSSTSYRGVRQIIPEVDEYDSISENKSPTKELQTFTTKSSRESGFRTLVSTGPIYDNNIEFEKRQDYQYYFPEWNLMRVVESANIGRTYKTLNNLHVMNFNSNLSFFVSRLGKNNNNLLKHEYTYLEDQIKEEL